MNGLPRNERATALAMVAGWVQMPGDWLAGDVVFYGPTDPEGNNTDVDDAILRHARHVPGWTAES